MALLNYTWLYDYVRLLPKSLSLQALVGIDAVSSILPNTNGSDPLPGCFRNAKGKSQSLLNYPQGCFHNQVLIKNHPLNQTESDSSSVHPPTPLPPLGARWTGEASTPSVGEMGKTQPQRPLLFPYEIKISTHLLFDI